MAIDPSILLQGKIANPLASLAAGYQLGNTIRQQPMVDQMNQQKLEAAKLQNSTAQTQNDYAKQKAGQAANDYRIKSAVLGSIELQNTPPEQWGSVIQSRIEAGKRFGIDTSAEEDALNTLNDPNQGPSALKQHIDALVKYGKQANIINENTTAWQRQFQDMTNGFSESDKAKAQRIAAGLDPRAVTVGNKIETVGGVPYIINPMTGGATVPSVLNQPVAGANTQGQLPAPVPSAIDANAVANNAATIERGKVAAAEKAKNDAAIAAQNTKNAANESDVNRLLDQAEPLIDSATSSGIGRARDAGLSVFGVSTDAGDSAAKLKTLEANLVMKMPRMEGPQSNMDQQLYRQMAAQVGDPAVPASQRKAAISMLRSISSKYTGGNQQSGQQPSQQSMQAPQQAIDYLKSNATPEIKAQFKSKYGYLPDGM